MKIFWEKWWWWWSTLPNDPFLAKHLNILDEIYLSARELAEHINGKVRTIENWAAAGNVRQDEQGKYGLISAFRYQLESLEVKLARTKLQLTEATDRASEETKDIRERKLMAEADKEEAIARIKKLEADKLEGKLVDAEEVLTAWQNAIAKTKAKFLALPAKLALELSGIDEPEAIQDRLCEVIGEGLIELSQE